MYEIFLFTITSWNHTNKTNKSERINFSGVPTVNEKYPEYVKRINDLGK